MGLHVIAPGQPRTVGRYSPTDFSLGQDTHVIQLIIVRGMTAFNPEPLYFWHSNDVRYCGELPPAFLGVTVGVPSVSGHPLRTDRVGAMSGFRTSPLLLVIADRNWWPAATTGLATGIASSPT